MTPWRREGQKRSVSSWGLGRRIRSFRRVCDCRSAAVSRRLQEAVAAGGPEIPGVYQGQFLTGMLCLCCGLCVAVAAKGPEIRCLYEGPMLLRRDCRARLRRVYSCFPSPSVTRWRREGRIRPMFAGDSARQGRVFDGRVCLPVLWQFPLPSERPRWREGRKCAAFARDPCEEKRVSEGCAFAGLRLFPSNA